MLITSKLSNNIKIVKNIYFFLVSLEYFNRLATHIFIKLFKIIYTYVQITLNYDSIEI